MTEKQLSDIVSGYMLRQYPNVLFRFDFGADAKMSINQAKRMKKLNGKWNRGFVDLFIYTARKRFHGLAIELKVVSPFKADGELKKNKHLEEQREIHKKLISEGYAVFFTVGFNETKEKIDLYLKED